MGRPHHGGKPVEPFGRGCGGYGSGAHGVTIGSRRDDVEA
jgi:hypothetical protein